MTSTPPPDTVELLAQYVRDMSFEHPDAPLSINHAGEATPSVDVRVEYGQLGANLFEARLEISASVKTKDLTIAIIELSYAGTYRIPPVMAEMREAFLMVEAPRDLFPFARAIIGLITQMAGIPPLLIATPDFADTYRASSQAKIAAQVTG